MAYGNVQELLEDEGVSVVQNPIEQAAELVLSNGPQIGEVTFREDGLPTVRNLYSAEQPFEGVVATSPEHLVQLLQEARRDYRRKVEQWIANSYSRTKA